MYALVSQHQRINVTFHFQEDIVMLNSRYLDSTQDFASACVIVPLNRDRVWINKRAFFCSLSPARNESSWVNGTPLIIKGKLNLLKSQSSNSSSSIILDDRLERYIDNQMGEKCSKTMNGTQLTHGNTHTYKHTHTSAYSISLSNLLFYVDRKDEPLLEDILESGLFDHRKHQSTSRIVQWDDCEHKRSETERWNNSSMEHRHAGAHNRSRESGSDHREIQSWKLGEQNMFRYSRCWMWDLTAIRKKIFLHARRKKIEGSNETVLSSTCIQHNRP